MEVYRHNEELCIRFHVVDCRSTMYCYRRGGGWRPVSETPKFVRYQPLGDNRLAEVYRIGDREYVRVT